MSSAYCETDVFLHFGLLTYILNKIWLIMLPWGTPASGVNLFEIAWLYFTLIFLLLRKLLVHFVIHHGVLILICLYKIPSCHTESKTCSISKKAAAVAPFHLKLVVAFSVSVKRLSFVHLPDL